MSVNTKTPAKAAAPAAAKTAVAAAVPAAAPAAPKILLTLGLYWPFAAIAMARLRVEAVSVTSLVDPDMLIAKGLVTDDAAGDAAGDLFGFDLGI